MPIPEQRDLERARHDIRNWLATQLPSASELELSPLTGPAFTGFSNETLLFDATWTEDGRHREEGFVLRVKPTAHTIFLESDFEYQYRVLKILDERSDVPVPPVHWYEEDESILGAPFFVMGKVEGRVPSDNPPYTTSGWYLDEATPADRARLMDTGLEALTRVHALDVDDLGLRFLDKPEYGTVGIDQQIGYYDASLHWAAGGHSMPVAKAALEWVRAHQPTNEEIRLSWGDARINNQMFDDDYRCVAVLDWEMTTLADPMMDVGWWLFLDRHFHEGVAVERAPGFPTREQMVARYEEVSGRASHDLEFYEVFAGLRFAVVMMRVAAMCIEFEILPPDTDLATNNIPTRLTAELIGMDAP
jgi:aminoglycoside phosphotransferase (APT) family kinase protein